MNWKDEFSVGIPEIDQQHMVIVECIALVEQAVAERTEKARWSAVHSAVGRLADYVRIHFAVEESLMRIHNYPGLEKHAQEHLKFSHDLMALQKKSLDTDVSEEMVAFLSNWLLEHIAGSDKAYASYLPTAGVARRPAGKLGR